MEKFFAANPIVDDVIAAGVSGGADSLALVLRLNDWAKKNGKKVVALTVDHKLRSESGEEAACVAQLMKQFGIEHHILTWEGEKPTSGIEEAARLARYRLIADWCQKTGVKVYATGHHMRDQAETFLLRLARGSGVSGLSGILPCSEMAGLKIIRPQLGDAPEELKAYLKEKNVQWVEDPSNQNDDFLRVKIRKFLPLLETEVGISVRRLADTCGVLARTRSFVDSEVSKLFSNNVKKWAKVGASLPLSFFASLHEEMQYRLLALMIKTIGQNIYTPEAKEVLNIVESLLSSAPKGRTLGGCEIFVFQKCLWVVAERASAQVLSKKVWEDFVKDNPRFEKVSLPYKLRAALVLGGKGENAS